MNSISLNKNFWEKSLTCRDQSNQATNVLTRTIETGRYLIHVVAVCRNSDVEENLENFTTQVDLLVAYWPFCFISTPQCQVENLNQVRQTMQILT